eukprot:1156580-Pelagomonas_calceolata.AAC.10
MSASHRTQHWCQQVTRYCTKLGMQICCALKCCVAVPLSVIIVMQDLLFQMSDATRLDMLIVTNACTTGLYASTRASVHQHMPVWIYTGQCASTQASVHLHTPVWIYTRQCAP